ncbi:aldose 1-epimerase [Pelagirhabdus alkalitolerans]|uniref:Aldose 1-epimerase n=1 Tax=Pelagirhabdus alkalitolerans TaxID=1612202 RepID=A0A1G6GK92_9BACI|nr:aldose 1-epimerase [Pelagirhabdus alkalitolerans]
MMQTQQKPITVEDQTWTEYTLKNDHGMEVNFLDFGGIITSLYTPNHEGEFENVVIGFNDYREYLNNKNFFGALIGRVAGRIENSQFTVNGETYELPANEGAHHLHGGTVGLHNVRYQVELIEGAEMASAVLYHTSMDGEGGYPGTVKFKITYTLTNDNDFSIEYEAFSDKDTILTLTNHSYFNLSGDLKDTVLAHEVEIDAEQFVELDEELIPTGKLLPVRNTVFDFTTAHQIADGVNSGDPQNKVAGDGYDHYFVFDQKKPYNVKVSEPRSGRVLTVKTDQPGMVMYTSNNLDRSLTLKERTSAKYLGVCLETQASPASVSHDGFPSIYLDAHDVYRKTTTFNFSTQA